MAYDTERFTSRSVVMSEFRPPMELAPAGIAPPISAAATSPTWATWASQNES